MGTAMPIWAQGNPKSLRFRLIQGKAELLLGMDIAMELDSAVRTGGDKIKDGEGEWEMMAFNEKHHWVFPLVPTACAYAKLDGYFGKL